jgi:pyruvate formate lyase activating enzyme
MYEARLYKKVEGDTVNCMLCPHRCVIKEGKSGICGIRINEKGTLYAAAYGRISAEAVDPIEKKPLFHFLPGTYSYSLGGVGCNFRCEHCQNWHISRSNLVDGNLRSLSPEEGVSRALSSGSRSISWTYNEPSIWHEYPLDMGKLAKETGLATIYVTNGYITEEGLREAATMLDAFRVDLKAFSDDFYRKVCGGHLQPVLDSTILAKELGLHIETVTLVIPGLNDAPDEVDHLIRWVIENLGPDTPMHFTRFHPDYKMREPHATPIRTLEKIYERAKELGLHYPYLGNVQGHPYEHTYCPVCGEVQIERSGYNTWYRSMEGDRCTACGEHIPYVSDTSA